MKLAIAFALIAAPAFAQEMSFDIAETQRCLEAVHSIEGEDPRQCVGASAEACVEATPGGYSTAGMSSCYAMELEWWDGQLNLTYADLMDEAQRRDAENGPYAPSMTDALREMQRAWIGFRDAQCAFVRSEWGGGTGGGPADIACQLDETAAQTFFLQASLGE